MSHDALTASTVTKAVNIYTGHAGNGNICINCALCCDGSLFRKARLNPGDDVLFLKLMGVESVTEDDRPFFTLPCYALSGKACTLYHDQRRFRVCRRFKCKLLKQFLSGEVSYDAALQTIREVIKRRQSMQELGAQIPRTANTTILSLINEIRQSGKMEERSFRQTYAQQLLDCVILEELLKSRFYRESRRPTDILDSTRE